MQKVPFVDLYAQYLTIKPHIDEAIESTIRSSSYIGGKPVAAFEKAFSEFIGVPHVIGCANGTDSIEILLQAFGIGKDDEVVVPAISWISTAEAVSSVGAKPVFVDIEDEYYTIDVSLIEKAITPRTKAIIPVHLYGHPADMPTIMSVAAKHNLIVIEDCAQAHGAQIEGKMIGTFGHAASFSFYPGKNLGAYGDAGAMATADPAVAEKARMIANHGQKGKHNHVIEGRNSRLDGLQAAVLNVKLPHLEGWTGARIANAAKYDRLLEKNEGIGLPLVKKGYRHVYHLYVVRVEHRTEVQKALAAVEIETAVHYPMALPFLPCYGGYGYETSHFPVAASCQNQILSIPMYAELTEEQIDRVSKELLKVAGGIEL